MCVCACVVVVVYTRCTGVWCAAPVRPRRYLCNLFLRVRACRAVYSCSCLRAAVAFRVVESVCVCVWFARYVAAAASTVQPVRQRCSVVDAALIIIIIIDTTTV